MIPAVWHVVDFDEDIDLEFPTVIRPTFSRVPPVGLSAGGAGRHARPHHDLLFGGRAGAFRRAGLVLSRGGGLWPAAVCSERGRLSGTAGRPGRPSTAGTAWAGERSRTRTRRSPCARRCSAAAIAIGGVDRGTVYAQRQPASAICIARRSRERHAWPLGRRGWFWPLLRQVEIPGVEPVGYWPRWAMIWAHAGVRPRRC